MPYDETLDASVARITSDWGLTHKEISDGKCYLWNGNPMCLVYKNFLILRLGEPVADAAIEKPFVKPFTIAGGVYKGWVMVDSEGWKDESALHSWLRQARSCVAYLELEFYGQHYH